MYHLSRLAAAVAVALALTTTAYAIQSVSRSGRYLYTADGNRFFIKGVAYQPQGMRLQLFYAFFSEVGLVG